jgi:2-polyprenyl-3-methyl-5-hydroxy-6-metoxy-1,4-benzoquinol methylase
MEEISYLTKKSRNFFFNFLLSQIKKNFLKKKIKILNIGCADCSYDIEIMNFLKKNNVTFSFVSSDLNDGVFCNQNRLKELKKFNWKFKKNKLDLNNSKQKYDIIMHHDVLEHSFNPYKFIKNIKKSLNKNGIHIFTTPNLFRVVNIIKLNFFNLNFPKKMGFSSYPKVKNEVHVKEYNRWDIKLLLGELKFKNIKINCYYLGTKFMNVDELLNLNAKNFNYGQNLFVSSQK